MKRTDKEKATISGMIRMMKDAMKKENRRELNKDETKTLVQAVMDYIEVAMFFFYKFLYPMMSGYQYKYARNYSVYDISTMVYAGFYEGGKWSRFVNYRYDTGIFGWVALNSSQILEKEGIIKFNQERSAKNTRLTIKSMRYKREREMVVNLVEIPQFHRLLSLLYVEKKDELSVKKEMGMDDDMFNRTLKVAEMTLKDLLIQQDPFLIIRRCKGKRPVQVNLVSVALSVKTGSIETIDSDDAMELASQAVAIETTSTFLDEQFPGIPVIEQHDRYILSSIEEVDWWSSMEKTIFINRYVYDQSPVILAHELGCRRTYIDVSFSRSRQEFEEYMDKRKSCEDKILKAASSIIRFSNCPEAIAIPTSVTAMTTLCKALGRNEINMCQQIAHVFTGVKIERPQLMKLLQEFDIVNYVDKSELLSQGIDRAKPADHYQLSSVYVARKVNYDVAKEIYNFSGPYRYKMMPNSGGCLTAAIGLTFMKRCVMKYG